MGELKYFKICTGWIKICPVTRLAWFFYAAACFSKLSPNNLYSNWTYLRDLPNLDERHCTSIHTAVIQYAVLRWLMFCSRNSRNLWESFCPRHFLTTFVGFVLFNLLRTNFGACDKFTTGLTPDYVKLKSLPLPRGSTKYK